MQQQIRAQQVDILVGTQMLAKGHDFPQLTLVGVVNADSALYSSGFPRVRAPVRAAHAGRWSGRTRRPAGEVLIQTDFPDHPLYDAVCRQDYAAFARAALDERRQAGFPPHSHQALLRAEATRREVVDDYLARAAAAGGALGFDVEIYDPVPPAIASASRAASADSCWCRPAHAASCSASCARGIPGSPTLPHAPCAGRSTWIRWSSEALPERPGHSSRGHVEFAAYRIVKTKLMPEKPASGRTWPTPGTQ